ncbi:3'-5' exoribonuclease [compost metagenome]
MEPIPTFIYLDTEFTGLDQAKPDLISIGLVDESGREFYAELPESHWTVQCNEWVHFNVLPHLWGGEHIQSEASIRDKLFKWIESLGSTCVIVTDCPDADFFMQLKRLLPQWPKNLAHWPVQFSAWSLGDDMQFEMQQKIMEFYVIVRPRHHALHDAHALRMICSYALSHGWRPSN